MEEVLDVLNQLIDIIEEKNFENKEDLVFMVEEVIDLVSKNKIEESLSILDDLNYEFEQLNAEELQEIIEEVINYLS